MAAAADPILLYFGAGWELSPLNMKDFRGFRRFVFIDALPALPHYEPGNPGWEKSRDRASFVAALCAVMKKHRGAVFTEDGDHLVWVLQDGRRLDYFINTTVEAALADPVIRPLIKSAKWVHQKGFHPFEYGLQGQHIPNCARNLEEARLVGGLSE